MKIKRTNRFLVSLMVVLAVLAITPFKSYGAVPQTMNYQGYLTDSGGNPIDKTVTMVFSIYNVATGGSALWTEIQNVTVNNGVYSIILGSVTPITLSFNEQYYLGVTVGADAEMTPRQDLTSVGYAFTADTLGGGAVNVESSGNVGIGTTSPDPSYRLTTVGGGIKAKSSTSDTSGYALYIENSSAASLMAIRNSGNVGIGQVFPGAKLVVNNPTTSGKAGSSGDAIYAYTNSTNAVISLEQANSTGYGIYSSGGKNYFSGNVGIGTESPGQKLSVAGTIESTSGGFKFPDGTIQATAATTGTSYWTLSGSSVYPSQTSYNLGVGTTSLDSTYKITTVGGGIKAESTTQPAGYFSSSSGYGLIVNSGNVGIGTTSPDTSYKLTTVGGGIKAKGSTSDTSGYALYAENSSSASLMAIRNDGKVGIGTPSPGQKLSVAGTIESTSGGFKFPDGTTQTTATTPGANWILSGSSLYPSQTSYNLGVGTTSLDSTYKITTVGGGIKAESTTQPAGYFSSSSGYGLIVNSGKVGIGQVSPGAKLVVNNPTTSGKVGSSGDAIYAYTNSTNAVVSLEQANSTGYGIYSSGGKNYFSGSVGIGTMSPGYKLEVFDATSGSVRIGSGTLLDIDTGAGQNFRLGTGGTERLTILDPTGYVGIGTASPSYKLHVIGDAAGTSWTNLSSREYKENIKKVNDSEYLGMLAQLMELDLTTYNYKQEYGGDATKKLGFVAEEMPEEVLSKDGKGVDVYELLAFTIGAMKAQQKQIEELKAQLKDMQ